MTLGQRGSDSRCRFAAGVRLGFGSFWRGGLHAADAIAELRNAHVAVAECVGQIRRRSSLGRAYAVGPSLRRAFVIAACTSPLQPGGARLSCSPLALPGCCRWRLAAVSRRRCRCRGTNAPLFCVRRSFGARTAADLVTAAAAVIGRAAAGEMTLSEAREFMQLLEVDRRVSETSELAVRIQVLEAQAEGSDLAPAAAELAAACAAVREGREGEAVRPITSIERLEAAAARLRAAAPAAVGLVWSNHETTVDSEELSEGEYLAVDIRL
jgi:hypothetical protein